MQLSGTNGRGLAPRSFAASSRQDPRSLHIRYQSRILAVRLLNALTSIRHAPLVWRPNGPGGESGVVPPVPIPNTAVKRSSAHDTGVTKPWENRPVPGPFGRLTSLAHSDARAVYSQSSTRGGAVVARRAHNPKVSGSNPLPATESTGRFTAKRPVPFKPYALIV